MVSSSAQEAVTKHHRLGSLKDGRSFLMISEAEKSRIRVKAGLVPGEGSPPSLQRAAFVLCVHMAERALLPLALVSLTGFGPHP